MSEAKKATSRPSGLDSNRQYISFDERGTAQWNWKKYDVDSRDIDDTFSFLKALDVETLRLEDAQLVSGEVVSGDPYNSPLKSSD
jgi:hypothetical protein